MKGGNVNLKAKSTIGIGRKSRGVSSGTDVVEVAISTAIVAV
jgi:hypothetical protein